MNNTPKKSLGQHWLHDQQTLESICDDAEIKQGDNVLEIGPGLGTLTDILLERGANVYAVELDKDLMSGLRSKFSGKQNIKLFQQNILDFNLDTLPRGYKVVANIPYYLTSNLIRKLSEANNKFSVASLLVQKEVAERICADIGQMSILSIATQFYSETSLGTFAPADLFTPPPKVDSQVVILKRRQSPLFEVDEAKFFRLVRAGFSEKRKMLRSSLSGGLGITKEDVDELLKKSAINSDLRAQALSLNDWHNIYKNY